MYAHHVDLGPTAAIDPWRWPEDQRTVFHTDERLLIGFGVALDINLPDGVKGLRMHDVVTDALVGISGTVDTSRYVMALGTLPFDPVHPASLVVPSVLFGQEADGRCWMTVVTASAAAPFADADGAIAWLERMPGEVGTQAGGDEGAGAHGAPIHDSDEASFRALVSEAVRVINSGGLDKVVLARQLRIPTTGRLPTGELLRRWRALEARAAVFAFPLRGSADVELFVGASPELLVRRRGDQVTSAPLAGTGQTPEGAGLEKSVKDAAEHEWVVRAIEETLGGFCATLDVPEHPEVSHFHRVTHLKTVIEGRLLPSTDPGTGGNGPSALSLAAHLHPTPAVAGVPTEEALNFIAANEPSPRGHYAGPVGYVNAAGDGEWWVGIRSLRLTATEAVLSAGAGVVKDSRPEAESAEVTLKLAAILDVVAPDVVTEAARTA